jgi:predicted Fe-Mo cluster-binding NifX family protein
MKIAVSSQNQTAVTAHLGRCQKFWIYDVDNATVQTKELLQLSSCPVWTYRKFNGFPG